MYRIISCISLDHDWRLTFLAALICVLSSATAIALLYRARSSAGRLRLAWLTLGSVAAGFGIWATHFIAMLAYAPALGARYNLALTVVSLGTAIVVTGLGQFLVLMDGKRIYGIAGGAMVGAGIVMMHYLGMAALDIPGHIVWDLRMVAWSVGLGLLLATLAFVLAQGRQSFGHATAAAGLFTLAILAMHFIGMAAVSVDVDPRVVFNDAELSSGALALVIAGAATLILCICLVAAAFDWRTRETVNRQKLQLDTALENMSQGLCMFDSDGHLTLFNQRYAELTGVDPNALRNATLLDVIKRGPNHAESAEELASRIMEDARSGTARTMIVDRADGTAIRAVSRPMSNGGWVATLEDITDWQRAQAQISHMARHDALTNLPNRHLFRERLEAALLRLNRDERIGVLSLDLDQFKTVNDTLGHPVGDGLLREVAHRLLNCVREGDTVARLGGDEFAIVQAGVGLQSTDVATLASRLVDTLSRPYVVKGHQIVIGTSIGISYAPDDGSDPDELLRNSDLALYRAKSDGRGTYRFFEPGMDARAQARRILELELRTALAKNEFELHYQPIHHLMDGGITHFEALVRWRHPLRGLVAPDEFIRLAEETGLIVPLGKWILEKACADAATWSRPVSVAVNVSPMQFRDRALLAGVTEALSKSGLPADRLELEITEAVLLQDTENTLATLHKLRSLGIRISMDDFGTGYSSLSYLRSFPFDRIKIDRSFVQDLASRDDAAAIIRAVAGLGRSLGIPTTAEGVETAEQADLLRSEGCTEVQGFYYGRPGPGSDVEQTLRKNGLKIVA